MSGNNQSLLLQWQTELQQLGALLLSQSESGEWPALKQTDARLAKRLTQLQSNPELKQQLAETINYLHDCHQTAYERCHQTRAELLDTMSKFNEKRDALRAYEESQLWR